MISTPVRETDVLKIDKDKIDNEQNGNDTRA